MTSLPSENRIDELFVRYWDDRLTDAESAELSALLMSEPLARDWFRMNSLHAVAAADLRADVTTPAAARSGGWSRRRLLQAVGGGLAATVAAGLLGRSYLADKAGPAVRLTAARGGVTVTTDDGRLLPPAGPLPANVTVTTHDANSSAVLVFPDGADVLLAGDTTVSLARNSRQLALTRGSAIVDIHPARPSDVSLSFLTAEALISAVSAIGDVLLTLTHASQETEVGVLAGLVTVTARSDESIDRVRDGQLLTLRADGHRSIQPLSGPAEIFVLDPAQPKPDGWFVGKWDQAATPAVIRPELWYDPYHKEEMFQIRSHHRWARGLFQLNDDSTITVRYRVRKSGPGQVSLVTRTEDLKASATGVLEWNGRYETGGWRSLTARAADLLDNREAPKFGPPWVAFLLIFNTYTANLGLEVADFRVTRPGGRVEG